jgi:YqjK-like protein
MSGAVERLRARRELLLRQAAQQRQELRAQLEQIGGAVDRADRGIALVRRVATPPVLVAGGVAMTFLLGRGGARKALAAGLAGLGLFLRVRSVGQLLAAFSGNQAVSRSR